MRTILLPIALALAPCFYFILKRFLTTLGVRIECHLWRLLLFGASLSLTLCGILLSWTSAVFLLHLAAFAGVVQLVNFILKKSLRARYERGFAVWKRLYGLLAIPLVLLQLYLFCIGLGLFLAQGNVFFKDISIFKITDFSL